VIAREDFVFVVGYSGGAAIVDAALKRKYGRLRTEELSAQGQHKAALSSAIYSGDARELEEVLAAYNAGAGQPVRSVEHLKRLFGVFDVPPGITTVKRL
jgi:hypothetical protein